jgi:type 1 fimbria pilin
MTKAAGRVGLMAAMGALACVCASASAYTMPGGTITFHGALVAPPFAIAALSATQSGAFTASSRSQTGDAGDSVASVSFDAPPYSTPSASVSIASVSGDAVPHATKTRFVDGSGKRIAAAPDGAFHVGASGGVLSMRAKGSTLMTVVTNYN